MNELEDVLREIELRAHAKGWQPNDDFTPTVWLLIEDDGRINAMSLPIDEVWAMHPRVGGGLRLLARAWAIASVGETPKPPGFHGAAVVTEGHALAVIGDTAAADQALAAARDHKVAEQPGAEEVRQVSVELVDGQRYTLTRWRKDDAIEMRESTGFGDVPAGLSALVKAIEAAP